MNNETQKVMTTLTDKELAQSMLEYTNRVMEQMFGLPTRNPAQILPVGDGTCNEEEENDQA